MRTRTLAVLVAAVSLVVPVATAAAAPFQNLSPWNRAHLTETLPIQYVFVGYSRDQVPEAAFRAGLPAQHDPVVLTRLEARIHEPVGVHYTLDHRVVYADRAWEDAFFGELKSLAVLESSVDGEPRTPYQQTYNDQRGVLDVGQNWFIDAPSVEHWLAGHAPAGVDTTLPTIFFVNWWGRDDFRFHTYTKFGEPDPDTGHDFGRLADSRKLIAWGGTPADDEETGDPSLGTRRVWFYDLSAGPESWNGGFDVTSTDVDGDGVADYRMPAVWEYLKPGGYRSAEKLPTDLGLIARYVGVDQLFAASPAFPAYFTPPRIPDHINLDINTYQGMNGVDASSSQYLKLPYIEDEIGELLRGVTLSATNQDFAFDGRAKHCWTQYVQRNTCYQGQPRYLPHGADLFLHSALNLGSTRDGTPGAWDAMSFNYATGDFRSPAFLGVTYDNFLDGTQSGIWNALAPGILTVGYGLTTTNIHEYGHLFSLNHPHDGYDDETGEYFAGGAQFFAWSGDETNSMMSYIDLNWDFSQFDRDNESRFRAASYVTFANRIAGRILDHGSAIAASAELEAADALVGQAQLRLSGHDYDGTLDAAKGAYDHVLAGAAAAGIDVQATDPHWELRPSAGDLPRNEDVALKARRDQAEQLALTKRLQP